MRILQLALALAACLPSVAHCEVFDLATLNWTLRNENGSISIPARIPSQVHLDLLEAGIITEPLLGINDFTQRWILNDNWTYTADLTPLLEKTSSNGTRTLLVFYGIDTIATITVAGRPVAWVNNQFQQYTYYVTDLMLSQEELNLSIALESAWTYGLNVTSRLDVEWTPGDVFEYPEVRQVVRKTQSDFGWDWGPAFIPSGIFKPALAIILSPLLLGPKQRASAASHPLLVSQTSPIFIEESGLEIHKVGQTPLAKPDEMADWMINITLAVRSAVKALSPSISISIPELGLSLSPVSIATISPNTQAPIIVSAVFTIPDGVPARWYPHNLGKPKLYDIFTTLHLDDGHDASFVTRTGFRTVTLVQTPYTQLDIEQRGITPGDQWHFEINGKAFFSSGTNIIPFDPFYSRVTSEQVRWVLQSAVLSGQNMLRVWGGGIYQPSDELTGGYDFYAACDELGLLAWSELVFSDTLYPINDFLLASVEPEVRQNVRRINKHPSNVQWAGGNEIEGIVVDVNQTLANGTHYLDEFVTLFQDFLHGIVAEETTSVAYTDCSTTSGVLSLDPLVLRFSNKTDGYIYGNGERYNYDASQAFNYSTYPVSRFVNEFGFHSQPSFFSWEEVLQSPEDFSFNSTVVMSRDHHPPAGGFAFPNPNAPQGQGQMSAAVELWLPTPSTMDANQSFAQWCWSTQVFQSMNMVSEIAWYRRGAGRGENTLGSLVWQMNDIWQGTSWSAVEHSGRWKVLQYGMAGAYAPVVIYPFWTAENETLEVVVTSDRWETVSGVAQLTWYDWHGMELQTSKHAFVVPTLNNSVICATSALVNILPQGRAAEDVWLLLNLTAEVEGRTVRHEQVFTPTSLAKARLVDPEIHVERHGDRAFTLSARSGVAAWTWLDHPAGIIGHFVDNTTNVPMNGFYLVPGLDRTVTFVQDMALSRVKSPNSHEFVVRSLWNNSHM